MYWSFYLEHATGTDGNDMNQATAAKGMVPLTVL